MMKMRSLWGEYADAWPKKSQSGGMGAGGYVLAALLVCVGLVSSVVAPPQPVVVRPAPPPPHREIVPSPRPGYVWVNGYWRWWRGTYAWEPGHWIEIRTDESTGPIAAGGHGVS
jgi:hypothetical protein